MIPQHSSASNEHYTPPDVVEAARKWMGGIDLDPASCEEANRTVKAARYCSVGGLALWWSGRVFLNPPGGLIGRDSSMLRWWESLACRVGTGDVSQAVFVAFTLEILRSSQRQFPVQDFHRCYPRSRLRFGAPGGGIGKSPTHANVIVGLGGDFVSFEAAFSVIGLCEPGRRIK